MSIQHILEILLWLADLIFGQQEDTAASLYDRIKAAVIRFSTSDLDGDGKREGVVREVLGWGANMSRKDIHLAIQLALKELELKSEQSK